MRSIIVLLLVVLSLYGCQNRQDADGLLPGQWSVKKANDWYAGQPWIVGCNFLPSTAINDVEMWQRESFDEKTIDKELALAHAWGMNSVRVFLNYVVWEYEPEVFKKNFKTFLDMAGKHGISVMPILFDDCNFSGNIAKIGKQQEPVPGIHNSGWVSSPPRAMTTDPFALPNLKKYVQDMVKTFAKDKRIIIWDLYNEPVNDNTTLVALTFEWAREMKPSQPLTTCLWDNFNSEKSQMLIDISDIVSFHGYDANSGLEEKIRRCGETGRPVVCTEWLFRQGSNTPQNVLPLFKEHRVGAYNWGLMEGRTQTYMHWGSPKDAPKPRIWQHDLIRSDGTPYKQAEFDFFRHIILGEPYIEESYGTEIILLPTSKEKPLSWKYSEKKPSANWYETAFSDADWQTGDAPFGTKEPAIGRNPGTLWTSGEIWLRTTFDLTEEQVSKDGEIFLHTHFDENATVYINGQLAAELPGFNAIYEEIALSPESKQSLKAGKNTIAVSVTNKAGGQYFDMGLIKYD